MLAWEVIDGPDPTKLVCGKFVPEVWDKQAGFEANINETINSNKSIFLKKKL